MVIENTPEQTPVTIPSIKQPNIQVEDPELQEAILGFEQFHQEMAALGHKPGCTIISRDGSVSQFEGSVQELINYKRELRAKSETTENHDCQTGL